MGLRYANFRYANLKKAVLQSSDLICTQFLESNLTYADFQGSNLEGADLRGANLTDTYFDPRPTAPEEGSFVAYKEVFDKQGNLAIARILIPEDAQHTTPLVGRACRAEFVKVLELSRDVSFAKCRFWPNRVYHVGGIVNDVDYDDDVQSGYSTHGIQFYLTREEVEEPNYYYPPLYRQPAAECWKRTIYKGRVDGIKCINQPDNKEGKWRAGKLFNASTAKLMNLMGQGRKIAEKAGSSDFLCSLHTNKPNESNVGILSQ